MTNFDRMFTAGASIEDMMREAGITPEELYGEEKEEEGD